MLEQPGTQFRIYRSAAVGDNQGGGIGAMMLPGTRIRGVIVDNPSGSWVKLDGVGLGFQPYIAPYTMAWSVSLLPSVTELSAVYVDGPIGQSSSNTGAPLVVYLFETQVPSSPGSAFVVSSAPVRVYDNVSTSATPYATLSVQVVAAPGVGKRIRILALYIAVRTAGGYIYGYLHDGITPSVLPFAALSGTAYSPVIPAPGILLDTSNAPLSLAYASNVASSNFDIEVYYSVELGY